MLEKIKQHIKSNYIEISLILSFLLILIPQPYLVIITIILGIMSHSLELLVNIIIYFNKSYFYAYHTRGAEQVKLFIPIFLSLVIITVILLFIFPSTLNLMCFIIFLLTGLAYTGIIHIYYNLPEPTNYDVQRRTMIERAIVLGVFFVLSLTTILTAANPLLLLLSISFYYASDILSRIENHCYGYNFYKNPISSLGIYLHILTLLIICLIPHSLVFIMPIYLAAPLVINTLEIILKTTGYEYSDSSFVLILGAEPYKINFEINSAIVGKIIVFSSLFLSPTLMPIVMVIGCAIIAIDNILLNFDINLSTNKNKRQPQSIYSSIAIVLMPISSLIHIPALFLPSSALCAITTINKKIKDIESDNSEKDNNLYQSTTINLRADSNSDSEWE